MTPFFAGLKRFTSRTELPVQVAAVCYRWNGSSVEFLLVKTTSGKWTFPKGRVNPSFSAAENAAREAWEEAGVRGRIAESHLDSYLDTKRGQGGSPDAREFRVITYLLEVFSTVSPEEDGRYPTWYSAHEAKRRLAEGRAPAYARPITRIVDSALDYLIRSHRRRLSALSRAQGRRLARPDNQLSV